MSTKKDDAAASSNDAGATADATPALADKPYYAVRDFNDAGTERAFLRGDQLSDVGPGSLLNYAAAGLASTERPSATAKAA